MLGKAAANQASDQWIGGFPGRILGADSAFANKDQGHNTDKTSNDRLNLEYPQDHRLR